VQTDKKQRWWWRSKNISKSNYHRVIEEIFFESRGSYEKWIVQTRRGFESKKRNALKQGDQKRDIQKLYKL
jgi:hypothetical protein